MAYKEDGKKLHRADGSEINSLQISSSLSVSYFLVLLSILSKSLDINPFSEKFSICNSFLQHNFCLQHSESGL